VFWFRYVTAKGRWSYQGAIALIVAIGIFLVNVIFYVGAAIKLAHGNVIAGPTVAFMTAGTSSLIGASAVFLGRVPDTLAQARKERDAATRR
jgi:hypothetical protein